MPGDWIKLHRKFLDHPIMKHDGLCRLWTYCLLKANWRDSQWLIPGTTKAISVPRGSFVTGRNALHRDLYPTADRRECEQPSASTLWRWLQSMEGQNCLKLKNVNNRCTLVTICNYETYQSTQDEIRTTNEQLTDSRCTTDEQPVRTSEELKKVRREEVIHGDKPQRFTRPTVEQVAEYCLERKNRVDAQKFVDYYTSNGWKVGKNSMKDWKSAVHTWEKNDYGNGTGKRTGKLEFSDSANFRPDQQPSGGAVTDF